MKFLDPVAETRGDNGLEAILYSFESRYKRQEAIIGAKIPRDIDNYSVPIVEEETFDRNKYV